MHTTRANRYYQQCNTRMTIQDPSPLHKTTTDMGDVLGTSHVQQALAGPTVAVCLLPCFHSTEVETFHVIQHILRAIRASYDRKTTQLTSSIRLLNYAVTPFVDTLCLLSAKRFAKALSIIRFNDRKKLCHAACAPTNNTRQACAPAILFHTVLQDP